MWTEEQISKTPAELGNLDFIGDGWKLQLPVKDKDSGASVQEVPPDALQRGYESEYFYAAVAPDGKEAVVFHCPVSPNTTPNTRFARSELREVPHGSDTTANWSWQGSHILVSEACVTHVPQTGKTITSQIHGIWPDGANANPLVKVQFSYDAQAGMGCVDVLFKHSTVPGSPDERQTFPNVALGQWYVTTIRETDGVAYVTVCTEENGYTRSETYRHPFLLFDPQWSSMRFYFKLGNYIQDCTDRSDGAYADVWVFHASVRHT